MKLLRALLAIQHQRGYLDDESLRALAREQSVPLYRLEGLVSFYPQFRRQPPARARVQICRDVACAMAGCSEGTGKLRDRLAGRSDVEVETVSCLGRCDSAPALCVNDRPLAPTTLATLDDVMNAIDDSSSSSRSDLDEPPRKWRCDPYGSAGNHYDTVRSLLATPDQVATRCIDSLKESRLRGMGGAGFPTGTKWELVRRERATPKYVICNADESEPGTFKDRMILEQLPHLVIEGMLLAGLSVGAERGIIYLRHEYEREFEPLDRALAEARSEGVLGDEAAGSGQAFDIEVFVSPGGYILGEETALLEALEDRRGEPRNKPPYPGSVGLWGKPTLINNVETFALATAIVHHGPEWWRDQGREGFEGLKFVSISGDVERPGVYEISMGMTVRELIDLAGGMKGEVPLKAFLPGGASSRFLRAEHVDTPIDFDAVRQAGSMLGTGAVIVFGEDRGLFELATNVVRFFRNESCGKCVPCRLGSEKAVDLLEGVQAGHVPRSQLAVLDDLGHTLEQTSICGLGQVALVPILSMLEQFPEEKG